MLESPFILEETTGRYISTRPVTDTDIVAQAQRIVAEHVAPGASICEPRAAHDFLILRFATLEHEVFSCLFLDTRHRVLGFEELFRGTVDGCSVHPREVVKAALRHNAAAVILAHNHPSGDTNPSDADRRITQRLKEALSLIDVRVLDHIVVGGGETTSFAESGLI